MKGFGTIRRLAFGLSGTSNPAWPIREAPHRRAHPRLVGGLRVYGLFLARHTSVIQAL